MTADVDEYDHYDAFDPVLYLHTFYQQLDSEGIGLVRFLHNVFEKEVPGCTVLEFGGGPTLIGMLSASRLAAEIHFAEYVPANRELLLRWLDGDTSDFDWSSYFRAVLEHEGLVSPTEADVARRMDTLRQKVTEVVLGDIYLNPPVVTNEQYDVIISNYCLDSVTGDYREWLRFLKNLSSLLRTGGTLSLAALQEVDHCEYQGVRYHNVYLNEKLLADGLIAAGYDANSIHIENTPADDHEDRNYRGVLFAVAKKL